MIRQNNKTKLKSKMAIENKYEPIGIKNEKQGHDSDEGKKVNFDNLLIITFLVGVILIVSSYAWFYATLDVRVELFKMVVSNHTGLFISLDGREFTSSVEISKDILITDMNSTYPNHSNQWAGLGLFPISSNGIRDSNSFRFDMFAGSGKGKLDKDFEKKIEDEIDECINTCDDKCKDEINEASEIECFNNCVYACEDKRNYFSNKVLLDTRLFKEVRANPSNVYIAFDFFLKNVSGSPKPDNLYFNQGTSIYYNDDTTDDEDGVINSLRIGLVKMGSVPLKSDINTIQNITCNNNCQMVIYEPNSRIHSNGSIYRARKYGVDLVDGEYVPTYAVIKEGTGLELANGHVGSGIPLDTEHFAMQYTVKDEDFDKPIFQMPNAITKMRAYVWIEGQDIDSLETSSNGGTLAIVLNLIKDLAGYY